MAAALGHAPLDEVAAGWASLSPEAQAILGPFLIPPFHAGSYMEPAGAGVQSAATLQDAQIADGPDPTQPWCTGTSAIVFANWSFVEADSGPAAGKVRIWYQNEHSATDLPLANDLMTAMETKIWPALTTLMAREPLPDGGSTRICGGGSDAVDIALLDGLATATTYAAGLSQQATSARTAFPRTTPAGWAGLKPYLAHEFFHMLQYSYPFASGGMSSGQNQWLREGTAQWAQDYVSSSHYGSPLTPTQTEHAALKYYFPEPEKPLNANTPTYRDYSSYVFWIWAARAGGDPGVVRQAWNAVAANTSIEAAKSVFGSGWDQAWKDFAKALWNKDPVTNFRDWDSITNTPAVAAEGTLPSDQITPVLTTVGPVGAKYLTFEPVESLTEVKYRNAGGVDPKAGIQAIISYKDGTKAVEDWSSLTEKDVPACDIESLTLVLSNSSVVDGDGKVFSFNWTPAGLGGSGSGAEGPTAAAAGVCLPPAGNFSGSGTYSDMATTTMDWAWSGNVEFEADGQANPWFPEYFTEVWDRSIPASGSVTISATGTVENEDGDCSISVPSQTLTYSPGGNGGDVMLIQPGPEPHYGIQLTSPEVPQGTLSCPDSEPYNGPFPVPGTLVYTEEAEQTATRGSYVGSATFGNGFFDTTMNWSFSAP